MKRNDRFVAKLPPSEKTKLARITRRSGAPEIVLHDIAITYGLTYAQLHDLIVTKGYGLGDLLEILDAARKEKVRTGDLHEGLLIPVQNAPRTAVLESIQAGARQRVLALPEFMRLSLVDEVNPKDIVHALNFGVTNPPEIVACVRVVQEDEIPPSFLRTYRKTGFPKHAEPLQMIYRAVKQGVPLGDIQVYYPEYQKTSDLVALHGIRASLKTPERAVALYKAAQANNVPLGQILPFVSHIQRIHDRVKNVKDRSGRPVSLRDIFRAFKFYEYPNIADAQNPSYHRERMQHFPEFLKKDGHPVYSSIFAASRELDPATNAHISMVLGNTRPTKRNDRFVSYMHVARRSRAQGPQVEPPRGKKPKPR
ncbi:hypothetical protein HY991_00525 [Candidatus Micrarchaeota archaeon]|nr:hypothetical protein [Candidatus Micrarchaeota archaeon]